MISALKAPDKETEMISQDIFDIIPASNDFFNLGPITQAPIELYHIIIAQEEFCEIVIRMLILNLISFSF